ncbi:MAG: flagellar regulator YcgR PilZN domain-containing protein [Burkholderiaceae bacterium]|nr:flagellar regulator YcgR PilZN domain-containing protein [Burkholderiaceae bacterium]
MGPDAPGSLNPQYRIEGEFAVRAVFRELMSRRSLVTLYPEGRADDALVTRIVHVAPDGVELDASGQPRSAAALRDARYAIGVAFPENVKTQFRLESMSVADERPADDNAKPVALVTTLQAPVPAEIYRLQRREAFRVRPPLEDEVYCVQRVGIGRELRHRLIDLSAGGLSLRLAADETPPAPGRIWRQSRIETATSLVIPCELVVRGVYEDAALGGDRRVAFAFHAMPTEVLRRVQMYVLDIEKRLRREESATGPTPACS